MGYNFLNENPLVSIIVPVYGTEPYLSDCIASILSQTYRNIEVILVDDQSPDKCPEICDSFARKDARVIVIHQENKGVSGARNTGIRRASGEYLMFVDSDDELYPDALKVLIKDAEEIGADIVSGTKTLVFRDGKERNTGDDKKILIYRGDEALRLSLDGNRHTNALHAKVFRRDIVGSTVFAEGKNNNEDGFFIFECFAKNPVFVQHNTPLYKYNYREGSGSKQAFSDKYLSMLYFSGEKRRIVEESYPQFLENAYNMEVRTSLQFLDLLCRTNDKAYSETQKACIRTVKTLYRYHRPISRHHRQLAKIVKYGLYPVYKRIFRLKYHL